jgi:transcriptional regulator
MYIHKYYREENREKILEFLRQNDFATLVVYDGAKPVAGHLMMEVMEEGGKLFVNGHMSKANYLWKMLDKDSEVLVIFQGPHTYISPTWYNHVNVPTWNYQAVHVYGKPQVITDKSASYGILKRLMDRYERRGPSAMEALPKDFVEKEMKGIVAFQIEVTTIEASYKLSQNRDDESYQNIVTQLEQRTDTLSHGVAAAMRQNRPPSR